nr:MAG TPA: hypothetical protein [Caudoviricetes sp.]
MCYRLRDKLYFTDLKHNYLLYATRKKPWRKGLDR